MPMSMTLKFRTLAQFLFREWQSNDALGLMIGCFCCMILAFIMLAMPQIRRRLLKSLQSSQSRSSILTESSDRLINNQQLNYKQKIASVLVYIMHAFLHVVLMIIIMNMNFYVIFSIVIGASLGYLATSDDYCTKKNNHQCCGHKKSPKKGYDSVKQHSELVEQTDRI